MGSTDSLADLARPLLVDAGLELWDIEAGPSVLRIMVDRPGGVDLDSLSAAAVALSPLLDEREDLVPAGRYDLEVSSPGIERTLRTAEQFRRYVGSVLAVKTAVAVDGSRRIRGTLVGVGDQTVELIVEGSSAPITVALGDIDRARTVLEWGPKPGKQKKPQGNRSDRPAEARVNEKDSGS